MKWTNISSKEIFFRLYTKFSLCPLYVAIRANGKAVIRALVDNGSSNTPLPLRCDEVDLNTLIVMRMVVKYHSQEVYLRLLVLISPDTLPSACCLLH